MSSLTVQNIQGSASSSNTINVASGHKISGAAGSIVAPGQVIQTLTAAKTDVFSTTSQSFVDIPTMTITITPSSTSSKILFSWNLTYGINGDIAHAYVMAMRGSTNLLVADDDGANRTEATHVLNLGASAGAHNVVNGVFLDSPNTTSATVYKLQLKSSNGTAIYINRSGRDNNAAAYDGRGTSSMCVQEIAG
jgi:hypothetical protein